MINSVIACICLGPYGLFPTVKSPKVAKAAVDPTKPLVSYFHNSVPDVAFICYGAYAIEYA